MATEGRGKRKGGQEGGERGGDGGGYAVDNDANAASLFIIFVFVFLAIFSENYFFYQADIPDDGFMVCLITIL